MKDKIFRFIKVFLLVYAMLMGFFFIYMIAWFALGLPIADWVIMLLMAFSALTEYGYYRWIRVKTSLTCKYCANLQDCIKDANLNGCEHNPDFEGERYCRSFKRKNLEDGCEYCANSKKIETDIDGDIEIVKMIPLPAIDLMTGATEEKADPPYWAMRLMLDGGEDFAKIYYCPMCGRELPEQ